jgi:hypothetical protein
MIITNAITYKIVVRDESGAESFRLSRGKMKIEWKYENGNGVLQNGNWTFWRKRKEKTEQRFPAKQVRKQNFCFQLIWNFQFRVNVNRPIPHASHVTLPFQTSKAALPKIGNQVIPSFFWV